ncbi:Uncharacterised protein [Chlamydia trachomatis]|nr:Uncharacterised protein [Chlamydia trachomatis]
MLSEGYVYLQGRYFLRNKCLKKQKLFFCLLLEELLILEGCEEVLDDNDPQEYVIEHEYTQLCVLLIHKEQ